MLDPITKKYNDESTISYFKFVFYCDCCEQPLHTTQYQFKSGFRPKIFMRESERKVRELIWMRDHDSAYERANVEALSQLNRCELCGNYICDDCVCISEALGGGVCCKKCFRKLEREGMK